MLLAQYLPQWLDGRIEHGELRPDTADDYLDSITRFLVPKLGHLKLDEIRGHHMSNAYDGLRRERAKAIEEAKAINDARRAEATEENKVKHSGRPRVAKLVPVPRPLGPFTIRRINNTRKMVPRQAVIDKKSKAKAAER